MSIPNVFSIFVGINLNNNHDYIKHISTFLVILKNVARSTLEDFKIKSTELQQINTHF